MLLLLACTEPAISLGDPDRPDRQVEEIPGNGDTADTAGDTAGDSGDPDDTGEDDEDDPSRVFSTTTVHTVELAVDDAGVASLQGDPYSYVPATVTVDGEAFDGAGIRIKGRLGSYRDLSGKAAFKVDLGEFGGTGELEGLESFNLNNMVQDCAFTKEWASYAVYERAAGIPAPRVGWAWVTVNGEPFGLYSLVEEYDEMFVARAFADPTGNLYDGDYELHRDGSYTLLDFEASTQDTIELVEGTDVGHADVHAVTDALAAAQADGAFEQHLAGVVDLDLLARNVAATAWIGQYDSYVYYRNNWRVYFDPGNAGRAVLLPWDPDWAFYASTPVTTPYGLLASACFADAGCLARVRVAVDEVSTAVDASGIAAELPEIAATIEPFVRDDPRKEVAGRQVAACQAEVETWFGSRSASLRTAFGL